MAQENVFQGEMDPEIAQMLGTKAKQADPSGAGMNIPDYSSIFNNEETEKQGSAEKVDLTAEGFPPITKRFEDTPHAAFDDANYYKTALSGEGELAQKIHTILQKFINSKDPKDRTVYRQNFIANFWTFYAGVGKKAPTKLPDPKKYMLRFGVLHPAFLDQELKTLLGKIVVANVLNQPVYYLDEWLKAVGTGIIRPSTTDEVKVVKNNNNAKTQQLLEKAQGKMDGTRSLLKAKDEEKTNSERLLQDMINHLLEHFPADGLEGISARYNDNQRKLFADIQELLRNLLKVDHDMEVFLKDYYQANQEIQNLQSRVEEEGAASVDVGAVAAEFETIRQMAKMTVGRQGNHFPILISEYYHSQPQDLGYRENIISIMAWIESIDPEAYCRTYKNRMNRIVPYVIIIPSYGDLGFCWEPFDKFNRATSRGRIAVPMFPKNLQIAVLTAVADFRWQVAKEKASFYWMEEGITGNYYQWFQKMKLKGDVKEFFIGDYITWITKESEGTQKLDKELRGILWRHLPFSKPVKEKLKSRSFIYQELYQRDVNRTMSDGY